MATCSAASGVAPLARSLAGPLGQEFAGEGGHAEGSADCTKVLSSPEATPAVSSYGGERGGGMDTKDRPAPRPRMTSAGSRSVR